MREVLGSILSINHTKKFNVFLEVLKDISIPGIVSVSSTTYLYGKKKKHHCLQALSRDAKGNEVTANKHFPNSFPLHPSFPWHHQQSLYFTARNKKCECFLFVFRAESLIWVYFTNWQHRRYMTPWYKFPSQWPHLHTTLSYLEDPGKASTLPIPKMVQTTSNLTGMFRPTHYFKCTSSGTDLCILSILWA